MVFRLLSMTACDDDDEQQRRCDEFEIKRREAEAQGKGHTALVENRTENNGCCCAQETKAAKELRADDNGSDSQNQCARAHRDVEIALILAHDAAGECDERIGNRETENFYFAAVLGETGDKSRVIAGCTKQKPGTGGEIRVHEQLDDKRDERIRITGA